MLMISKLRSKTAKDKAYTEHGCGPCKQTKMQLVFTHGENHHVYRHQSG